MRASFGTTAVGFLLVTLALSGYSLAAGQPDCDVDGDGIIDSTDPECWGGGPPPGPCSGGQTVGCLDNCPGTFNPDQDDQDGDAEGDACDCDVDGDFVNDSTDAECWGGGPPPGPCSGGQTVGCLDNCPGNFNPDQDDQDGDAEGDACDCDVDGDFVNDSTDAECWGGGPPPGPCSGGQSVGCLDNCPGTFNPDQDDQDGDAEGDACDCDVDGDFVNDSTDAECWGGGPPPGPCSGGQSVGCLDNCPGNFNPDQDDQDGDAEGDACDCDVDGDFVNDSTDAECWGGGPPPGPCSGGQSVGCLDNCPGTFNPDQDDQDGDAEGDACDCDVDGDFVNDSTDAECWGGGPPPGPCSGGQSVGCLDNCPGNFNPDQDDQDGDAEGDACDCDVDGDFVNDSTDAECWGGGPPPGPCSGGQSVGCLDNCPGTFNPDQDDQDGDAEGDACDCDVDGDFVNDSTDAECWGGGPPPGPCSGGQSVGCLDNCPGNFNPDQDDQDGDAEGDACDCDVDGDFVNDSTEAECWGGGPPPGPCSGGQSVGCLDNCPGTFNPDQDDQDGDAEGDACDCDVDGDFVNDSTDAECWGGGPPPGPCSGGQSVGCLDNCPGNFNPDQDDQDGDRVGDPCDNCPEHTNESQSDADGDAMGDHCDLSDGTIYILFEVKVSVDWQSEQGFDSWNCYRGDLDVLQATGVYSQAPGSNDLARRDCGLEHPWIDDPEEPDAAKVAFYLVTGMSGGLESDLGRDSAGNPRPNDNPCP